MIIRQLANCTSDAKTKLALDLCIKIFEENLNFQISGTFMPNPGLFNLEEDVILPVIQIFNLPRQTLEFRRELGLPNLQLLVDKTKVQRVLVQLVKKAFELDVGAPEQRRVMISLTTKSHKPDEDEDQVNYILLAVFSQNNFVSEQDKNFQIDQVFDKFIVKDEMQSVKFENECIVGKYISLACNGKLIDLHPEDEPFGTQFEGQEILFLLAIQASHCVIVP